MWNTEDNNVYNSTVTDEYRRIIKKARKKSDDISYIYIQIIFSAAIILSSFIIKDKSHELFSYVKDNYAYFFENENYTESAFSYSVFLEKLQNELQTRFNQLVTVFNSRGSADIIPFNVSTKKIQIKEKGMMPAQGYISSPYGIRKNPFNNKEEEFHTGMDIAAAKGTFIKASFSGVIVSAQTSEAAGNYIRIKSENNIETLYAHNQFLLVKEGDYVVAGQVIATIGDTGRATGPHLHFEFILDGMRYNPIYAITI